MVWFGQLSWAVVAPLRLMLMSLQTLPLLYAAPESSRVAMDGGTAATKSRPDHFRVQMVVDKTLIHNTHDLEPFLGHDPCEHPLVAQLGGNDVDGVSV